VVLSQLCRPDTHAFADLESSIKRAMLDQIKRDRLLQFAKQPVKPVKVIHVPVYDFTERAVGQGIMRELS